MLLTGSLAYAVDGGSWKSAEAEIKDSRGQTVGSAVFTPTPQGVALVVEVSRLAPGKHGLKSPEGAHSGDLPNLEVGSNEKGKLTATLSNATLGVADDEMTDPSGNSGDRIACGVIIGKR